MKIQLVRIGNSRGIRIPKPVIEQCGFGETVELQVEPDRLVIRPDRRLRRGWKRAFAAADSKGRDSMILEGIPPNQFDQEEWTW